jgi:hypothetical protein
MLSFASLIAYLATQETQFATTGIMPPMGRLFITTNYVGVLLQALLMIPVARAVHSLVKDRAPAASRVNLNVALVALSGVALLRFLLLLSPAVSDILFMAPMGFVGLWLITSNWLLAGTISNTLRVVGTLAGVGLVILGASFFFLGGLLVFRDGPYSYANNVNFHIGIGIGGFPGFIVYPIWTIFLGRWLLRLSGTALARVAA